MIAEKYLYLSAHRECEINCDEMLKMIEMIEKQPALGKSYIREPVVIYSTVQKS